MRQVKGGAAGVWAAAAIRVRTAVAALKFVTTVIPPPMIWQTGPVPMPTARRTTQAQGSRTSYEEIDPERGDTDEFGLLRLLWRGAAGQSVVT
jgi:hypothetical protein